MCTLRALGSGTVLQIESFHSDNKAKHENLPLDGAFEARLAEVISTFGQANLITTVGEAEHRRNKKGHTVLLGGDKLQRKLEQNPTERVKISGNDKEKQRILSGEEPFLRLLGVSDANGRIHDKKRPKFRQINRFLELIRDTLPHLPKGEIRICDLCLLHHSV